MVRSVMVILSLLPLLPGVFSGSARADGKGLMETNGMITVGRAAPPISALDLRGQAFSLDSFKGRPVFIDFGSVLCGACAKVVEEMNRLEKRYASTDLKIVMIADGAVPMETTVDFFSRLGASFTVIRDGEWRFFASYGVTVVPFKVLVDREGAIRKMHLGYSSDLDDIMDFKSVLRR